VARVVKEAELRRNEILDVAQQLFYSKGYDDTSIQEIIDAVGIAKGTFYHHFQSKQELLDHLIDRMFSQVLVSLEARVNDDTENAIEKLQELYLNIGIWKAENKEFFYELVEAFHRPENLTLRYTARNEACKRVAPLLTRIIRQGIDEGLFDTEYPDDIAEVILGMSTDLSNQTGELLLRVAEDPEAAAEIERVLDLAEDCTERLLGTSRGALTLFDKEVVREFCDLAMRRSR
jgi:AcrR family transcriptional regulator